MLSSLLRKFLRQLCNYFLFLKLKWGLVKAKAELRALAKSIFSKFSKQEVLRKNLSLSRNLESSLGKLGIELIVGGFSPLMDEPDWHCGVKEGRYHLAFPRINDDGSMNFAVYHHERLQEKKHFGVSFFEPDNSCPTITPDIILVPGLGFERTGDRLGRGKGFYDKYLEDFKGIKIGITFNETLFPSIPVEDHDQKMNMIITDKEIIKID